MKFSKVPHRRRLLGGTLAVLLILSGYNVQAQQEEWKASGKTLAVAKSKEPNLPPLPPPVVATEPAPVNDVDRSPLPKTPETVEENLPKALTDYNEAVRVNENEGVPVGTKKLTLQECISLAMEKQPALAAAQASYGAAYNAYVGLNELNPIYGLLSHDLKIRKQQACLGIQIAQAGLAQAEWDTRYAVTRNYYSVVYARQQSALVQRVVDKLDRAHKRAVELAGSGDPKIKVNNIDVATLYIAREKTKARGLEASIGVSKAMAALHEAIGLTNDEPLDVVDSKFPGLVGDLHAKELIALALSQRGELTQAQITAQVTELEVIAQKRIWFKPTARTFASGADIHATQIPQGLANGEYRPGAIPPEMAANLFGPRWVRMERARFFSARAGAVVDKTENLISLEAKVAYFKWKDAAERLKIYEGDPKVKDSSIVSKTDWVAKQLSDRFNDGNASGKEYLEARGAADMAQIDYNEALYNHALALITLERVTAGGFRLAAGQP